MLASPASSANPSTSPSGESISPRPRHMYCGAREPPASARGGALRRKKRTTSPPGVAPSRPPVDSLVDAADGWSGTPLRAAWGTRDAQPQRRAVGDRGGERREAELAVERRGHVVVAVRRRVEAYSQLSASAQLFLLLRPPSGGGPRTAARGRRAEPPPRGPGGGRRGRAAQQPRHGSAASAPRRLACGTRGGACLGRVPSLLPQPPTPRRHEMKRPAVRMGVMTAMGTPGCACRTWSTTLPTASPVDPCPRAGQPAPSTT